MRSPFASVRGQLILADRFTGDIVSIAPDNPQIKILFNINDVVRDRHSPPEIYGVCYNNTKNELWITDKRNNNVLAVRDEDGQLVSRLVSEAGMSSPCMLDFHPTYGTLAACFGDSGSPSKIMLFREDKWILATNPLEQSVTHCCWLPEGGFCYATRTDAVLYFCEKPGEQPIKLTLPNLRMLCPKVGKLAQLRLRYVQGLFYSKRLNGLIVGDANLGAIYNISFENRSYSVLLGEPALGDTSLSANLKSGSTSNRWLGPIRAVCEDSNGDLLWLDGESGNIFRSRHSKIEEIASLTPGIRNGCGMLRIDR